MLIEMLKGKIHRATVTEANVDYVGSISIDRNLMKAAGLLEYEKVQVADVSNGERLETYVLAAPEGSGKICMNGAAALKIGEGDLVIIMAYAMVDTEQANTFRPKIVLVDGFNNIVTADHIEKCGDRI